MLTQLLIYVHSKIQKLYLLCWLNCHLLHFAASGWTKKRPCTGPSKVRYHGKKLMQRPQFNTSHIPGNSSFEPWTTPLEMFVMNQYCPKRSDIVESMLATVEMNPLHRHPSMRHEIVVVVKTTNVDRHWWHWWHSPPFLQKGPKAKAKLKRRYLSYFLYQPRRWWKCQMIIFKQSLAYA